MHLECIALRLECTTSADALLTTLSTIAHANEEQTITGCTSLELRATSRLSALNRILDDISILGPSRNFGAVRGPRNAKVVPVPREANRAWILVIAFPIESFPQEGADVTSCCRRTGGGDEGPECVAAVAAEFEEVVFSWEFAVVPVTLGHFRLVQVGAQVRLECRRFVEVVFQHVQLEFMAGGVVEMQPLVVQNDAGRRVDTACGQVARSGVDTKLFKQLMTSESDREVPSDVFGRTPDKGLLPLDRGG
jgi:hypothetical protein